MLAKLKSCGFSTNTVNHMHNYLKNRKQGFQNYSLLMIICNRKNNERIKSLFLSDFSTVNNGFYEHFVVLNPGKCHYMCLGKIIDDNKMIKFIDVMI